VPFTPPSIIWDTQAADFVDGLVDLDIAYLEVQIAIEELLHAGLLDAITVSFDLDGVKIHWHWMPPLGPGMLPLDTFASHQGHETPRRTECTPSRFTDKACSRTQARDRRAGARVSSCTRYAQTKTSQIKINETRSRGMNPRPRLTLSD
jgi:hypothetical protein